jgi:hypothetical protein
MQQATNNILMIRPVRFGFNEQTATSNAFQDPAAKLMANTQELAQAEFDNMVAGLRAKGVNVIIVEDTPMPHTPDSIFPNNWISFHSNGRVLLYPMEAPNRRDERRADIIEVLKDNFEVNSVHDLSYFEAQNIFLEGTGSLVLDRPNGIAYACISTRTNKIVLKEWLSQMSNYEAITFEAVDQFGKQIYHTNVLMCVGDTFAVICLEAIKNDAERKLVVEKLETSGKEIIEISYSQMNSFAGNMLLVATANEKNLLVMSTQAFESLNQTQIEGIEKHTAIFHANIKTIETNGGGSARCMMAEVHLPRKA